MTQEPGLCRGCMDIVSYFSSLAKNNGDALLGVKAALLKFFWDKGFYFDVKKHLEAIFDEFTLNNMISIWAGRDVSILSEEPLFLDDDARELLGSILSSRALNMSAEKGSVIGRIYGESIPSSEKKEKGVVYTPEDICEYMTQIIAEGVKDTDRLFDPACGCGIFLEAFYDCLMARACVMESGEYVAAVHRRIIEENIFGADTSPQATAISKIILALRYHECVISDNIVCRDSLLSLGDELNGTFDFVVTNPPYVGHKQIKSAYRRKIAERYPSVYKDKADLSYCFFALAERLLKDGGRLVFVTGRYFAQSRFAEGLRKFIIDNFTVDEAVDFYGLRPFKTAGVDPMIISMTKGGSKGTFKAVKYDREMPFDLRTMRSSAFGITMNNSDLSADGFNFLSDTERLATERIVRKSSLSLADTVEFFQGVITGCDKAFVADSTSMLYFGCIDECGRKWIKSRDVQPDGIEFRGQYVLYTNGVDDIESLPQTLSKISVYKETLLKRRECIEGTRKWYELQWPRRRELFDEAKLVFPYKNDRSLFVYDEAGFYFSADVYGMRANEQFSGLLDLRKLALLLTSPVYDAYFKTFAKQLGGALYEYYPNTVKKMMIPPVDVINGFDSVEEVEAYFRE